MTREVVVDLVFVKRTRLVSKEGFWSLVLLFLLIFGAQKDRLKSYSIKKNPRNLVLCGYNILFLR